MAFVDVEIPEGESGGEFFKFSAVGDRLLGVFVSKAMDNSGKFGPKMAYTFRTKEGTVVVTPPTKLAQGFEKADLQPGHRVIAEYTKDLPPPADKPNHSPTKLFKLQVDRDAKAPAAVVAPKPAPAAAAAAADEFADIPL